MTADARPRPELPPLTVDEEHLVAAIREHGYLYETDIHDYLLFVRGRREVTDTVAKEHYPTWPTGEESAHDEG